MQNRNYLNFLILIVFLFFFSSSSAFAAVFYVAPAASGGSNSSPGTASQPWATLQYAANHVGPGDTVIVRDGNYSPFNFSSSGTSGSPIIFQAENKGAATIAGSISWNGRWASIHIEDDYITVDGFNISPAGVTGRLERGIRVSGSPSYTVRGIKILNNTVKKAGWVGITSSFAEGIIIEGNDVSGSKDQHGIYVANSADNPVIRNNIIYDNNQAGLHMNGDLSSGGDGVITNALVEGNIIYNNGTVGGGAINMDGVENSLIINNLLFNNHSHGITQFMIDASSPCKNNKIINNTIVMPSGSNHGIRIKNGSTGIYLRNNILINSGSEDSIAIDADSISGFDSDYNILTRIQDTDGNCCISLSKWQSNHPGQDVHSYTAPPLTDLFVNPVNNVNNADYSLKSSSIGIDNGTSVNEVKNDIEGTSRPQGSSQDIGAYEFKSGIQPPGNVTINKL